MSRPTLLFVLLALALTGVWWLGSEAGPVRAAEAPGGWRTVQPSDEAGDLVGRLLLDEGVPARELSVRIEARLANEVRPTLRHLPLDVAEDGRFWSPPLPPCRADLVVRLGDEELLRLEGIDVPPRGSSEDPRLDGIDLRGLVNVFELELFDAGGEPVSRGLVGWRSADPARGRTPYADSEPVRDGRAVIHTSHPWIDVVVVAPGVPRHELHGLSMGRELHLPTAWPLRLELPPGVRPEEDGVRVTALLTRPEPEIRAAPRAEILAEALRDGPEARFEDGVAEVRLPAPGAWELEWVVLREVDYGLDRLELGGEPVRLEIEPGSRGDPVRPSFPLESYRAELAAFAVDDR